MDPTLTREKAHKVFGDLYRKSRSADAQKAVDEIVSKTSDIFLRIQKIEELDEKENKKNRPELPEKELRKDKNARMTGRPGAQKTIGDDAIIQSGSSSQKKPGVLKKLLGGDVARWGGETGTLDSGWFGMNLKLSKGSFRLFIAFKEDQIVSIIKAFRLAVAYGWENWNPEQYNTVMSVYQFFNELVKMPSILKIIQKPDQYATSTIKLQRLYASVLLYASYEKIMSEDFLAFVEKNQGREDLLSASKAFVKYLRTIDAKSPTLQNVIRAFYALGFNEVRSWESIVNEIRVPPPSMDAYRAPDSVLEKINAKVKKLKEEIKNKGKEVAEISEIRKTYFTFEGSRVQTGFLNPICEQIMTRIFQKNLLSEVFMKNQKNQPHRLLYLILKDLDMVVHPVLSNPVNIKTQGGNDAVVIFRPGLFKAVYDELNAVIRELESFIKNNPNLIYSFKDFHNAKGEGDGVLAMFFAMVKRANKVFTRMVLDVRTVIENHKMAVEAEKRKGDQEKMARTKGIPIESFDIGMRFIPFADRTVLTNDRLNGMKILDIMNDVAKILYNYLYIYKDEITVRTLASAAKLQAEIKAMENELRRMGVTAE